MGSKAGVVVVQRIDDRVAIGGRKRRSGEGEAEARWQGESKRWRPGIW